MQRDPSLRVHPRWYCSRLTKEVQVAEMLARSTSRASDQRLRSPCRDSRTKFPVQSAIPLRSPDSTFPAVSAESSPGRVPWLHSCPAPTLLRRWPLMDFEKRLP